jgi:predicted helicase
VKWSETLKRHLSDEDSKPAEYSEEKICGAAYRPFTKMSLYYDSLFVDRPGKFRNFFPTKKTSKENCVICVPGSGAFRPFHTVAVHGLVSLDFIDKTQCFPLLTYSEDGKHKQDNITPKARTLFQIFYVDDTITQADIFHYVYAVLHHPAYRIRFAENLKRDLPRIPFIGVATGGGGKRQLLPVVRRREDARR